MTVIDIEIIIIIILSKCYEPTLLSEYEGSCPFGMISDELGRGQISISMYLFPVSNSLYPDCCSSYLVTICMLLWLPIARFLPFIPQFDVTPLVRPTCWFSLLATISFMFSWFEYIIVTSLSRGLMSLALPVIYSVWMIHVRDAE